MARYTIVPSLSRVRIDATSSVHPIHAEMTGLEGWIDLEVREDGSIDVAGRPGGHLSLPVSRLKSGNPLEDRELKRRIDARRYPTIDGDLSGISATGRADGRYAVRGTVTFRGVAREYEEEMDVAVTDDGRVELTGRHTFDVRDFGMEPPRILMLRVHPEVDVQVWIVAESG